MHNDNQDFGKYERLKDRMKIAWGKLTDNEIMLYRCQRQEFLSKLREHYGLLASQAEAQIAAMQKAEDDWHPTSRISGHKQGTFL